MCSYPLYSPSRFYSTSLVYRFSIVSKSRDEKRSSLLLYIARTNFEIFSSSTRVHRYYSTNFAVQLTVVWETVRFHDQRYANNTTWWCAKCNSISIHCHTNFFISASKAFKLFLKCQKALSCCAYRHFLRWLQPVPSVHTFYFMKITTLR